MMEPEKLEHLLQQYLQNTISPEECRELLSYLKDADPDKLADLIDPQLLQEDMGPDFKERQAKRVFDSIKADPRFASNDGGHDSVKAIRPWWSKWIQVAAVLMLVSVSTLYFFRQQDHMHNRPTHQIAQQNQNTIIHPGGNIATLQLANGRLISLSDAQNGTLVHAGNVTIRKTRDGKVVYRITSDSASPSTIGEYNVLTTPKGGEYQIELPDGTQVWLNSASSLSYPVAFTGTDRRVKLTGEAYFEVAKNPAKPFYVEANNAEIRVLGTHFNISSYNDDPYVVTTLLEGSVSLTKNGNQSMLKPGEQAVIRDGSDNIDVSKANISEAMAWKNGYFIFNDEPVENIMKKISRWYDADIEYRGDFSSDRFGGTFYRKKSINELLRYLEKIGDIHFTISGRRIIVMR